MEHNIMSLAEILQKARTKEDKDFFMSNPLYQGIVFYGNLVLVDIRTMEIDQEKTGYYGISKETLIGDIKNGIIFHGLRKPWIEKISYIDSLVSMMNQVDIERVEFTLNSKEYELIPGDPGSVKYFKSLMMSGSVLDWYDNIKVTTYEEGII